MNAGTRKTAVAPLKQFLSILGVLFILVVAYTVISGFFNTISNDTFDLEAPGRTVLFSAPLQPSGLTPASGYIYYVTYPKGSVLYFENINVRTEASLDVYLGNDPQAKGLVDIGELLTSRGNLTLYVPEQARVQDYSYILLWSAQSQRVIAYANVTH